MEEKFLDMVLPKATPRQMAKALQQIMREADRELRKKVEEENRKISLN